MEQPGSAAVSKRRRGTQLDVTTTVLVQKGKNTKQRQIVNFFLARSRNQTIRLSRLELTMGRRQRARAEKNINKKKWTTCPISKIRMTKK